ncbi:MAG: histidine phosphatase family protein [Deltaproteobacteria bacterium]|nr:histidine phosphatase family protein [Deltaproteobacteria bacterium]
MSRRAHAVSLLLLLLCAIGCSAPAQNERREVASRRKAGGVSVVYLVRHAEKARVRDGDDDPPLSAKGRARARALEERLASVGLAAIYVTQYQRTGETAAPLASRLGLTPQELPATDSTRLVQILRERHRGAQVLVVGHSNTIPEILAVLGVGTSVSIEDQQYGDLFVVTLRDGEAACLSIEHVGE